MKKKCWREKIFHNNSSLMNNTKRMLFFFFSKKKSMKINDNRFYNIALLVSILDIVVFFIYPR